MDISFEEMYERIINAEHDNFYYDDSDDGEEFFTGKELVKQEKSEETFGKSVLDPNVEIEEEIGHFKIYNKRRVHKYTETEMKKIRESCECTIVHDFGEKDIYHLSDEERAENDMLAELSVKLGTLKKTYMQVDQYIEAMRVVVQAWEILARNNYIHSEDEFFELVAEGRIISNRFTIPKLKKINMYNLDMIIKYISDPDLDPKDLTPIKDEEDDDEYTGIRATVYKYYYDERYNEETDKQEKREKALANPDPSDEEKEDAKIPYKNEFQIHNEADEYANDKIREMNCQILLSLSEAEYLRDNIDNPPSLEIKDVKRSMIKGYDRKGYKPKKKMNKTSKYIMEDLHGMLNKIQNNSGNDSDGYSRSYMLTNGMFDIEKPDKDVWDDLRFDGSWADDEDIWLYDLAIRDKMSEQHPPRERYLTYADKYLQEFFTILEKHGVNTIDLRTKMSISDNGNADIINKKQKKENKKIESQLLSRLTELNDDPKFKKIVTKAEKALNEQLSD